MALVAESTLNIAMEAKQSGGAPWDLSGQTTVTLKFNPPIGDSFVRTATIDDGPAGLAHYTLEVDDILVGGTWERRWRIQQGAIDLTSLPIVFEVVSRE